MPTSRTGVPDPLSDSNKHNKSFRLSCCAAVGHGVEWRPQKPSSGIRAREGIELVITTCGHRHALRITALAVQCTLCNTTTGACSTNDTAVLLQCPRFKSLCSTPPLPAPEATLASSPFTTVCLMCTLDNPSPGPALLYLTVVSEESFIKHACIPALKEKRINI